MEVQVFAILFVATAIYAFFLEKCKHLWEPSFTWLEVVIGTALVLAVPAYLARAMGADWLRYEQWVWMAFLVGGTPIVAWQLFRTIRNALQTRAEQRRLLIEDVHRYGDTAGAMAEQRGAQPGDSEGDR